MSTIAMPERSDDPFGGLSDDDVHEVIDGKILERPPMGSYPVELASILHEFLAPYLRKHGLGRSIINILLRINPSKIYRPDLVFISAETWPIGRRSPRKRPWDLIPDLAVEVISEHDTSWDVLAKVRDYFEAGVRGVWLIYPNLESIHVFDSFTQIHVLTKEDTLDGGDIVPGFQLPLALLFAGEPADEDDSESIG